MKAQELLDKIKDLGIEVITGVPDSTLKQFCDGLQLHPEYFRHYVTANEGAAVGLAVGTYLASGRPACVYMQNSGIGNMVNPFASLAHEDIYQIPMLFLVGWRGEPGVKDEPQHVFQGKITCALFDTLSIPYEVAGKDTTIEEWETILQKAADGLKQNRPFAVIIKKGTFEPEQKFTWENGSGLIREEVLCSILKQIPEDACIVSTTGKISRELYEQSNRLYGNHDRLFMTVGGMGHASMIAFGIAQEKREKKVICIDGDGAVLMHMGALPFLASNAPDNFIHIVINNQAHESVGAMPTGCRNAEFARIAKAAGYVHAQRIMDSEELAELEQEFLHRKGPALYEIMVGLKSRADLGRPAETAADNRDAFMRYLGSGKEGNS